MWSFVNKAWVASVSAVPSLSEIVTNMEFWKSLNNFSNEVSKSMDMNWINFTQGVDSQIHMSAFTHRILDGGHTISASLEKAFELGKDLGWSKLETFEEWGKAYFSDLSSRAGMPAFEDFTGTLFKFLQRHGVSEERAREIVTINGQEALNAFIGGTISAVSLFFSWSSKDSDNFSRAVASVFMSGVKNVNPLTALVGIVGMAIGYQQKIIERDSFIKGGIVTGASMLTIALIPGLLPGLIGAVVVSTWVNKKMDSVNIAHFDLNTLSSLAIEVKDYFVGIDFEKVSEAISKLKVS